jgi:heme/copper-type cytochrome/quinol oxidase subunit 2
VNKNVTPLLAHNNNSLPKGSEMKPIAGMILVPLVMLANNAQAVIAMPEREHVQTIVWVMEAVTFVTIAAIFWFVWRISMRAKENRKPKREN